MTTYSYDDTGVYFAFFVVSVLALLLIPATARWLTSGPRRCLSVRASSKEFRPHFSRPLPLTTLSYGIRLESFAKVSHCKCDVCKAKYARMLREHAGKTRLWSISKVLVGLAGWAVVGYLCYVIYNTQIEQPATAWDPWEILGVSRNANRQTIKQAYNELSLKWHPDKVEDDLKEEAHDKFVELGKAKSILTNPAKLAEFEEWGHPDGKQTFSMGIALPTWIIQSSNSPIVLLTYGSIFGLLLPYSIARWWYRTRKYTKDGIMSKSMGTLFKSVREDTMLKDMIGIVAMAREFVDEVPLTPADKQALKDLQKGLEREFRTARDEQFVVPAQLQNDHARKAYLLLQAYLNRVPTTSAHLTTDQAAVVAKAFHLIQRGILQITLARGWLVPSLFSMDLTQMLVQGVTYGSSPLLQLPHITAPHIKTLAEMPKPVRSLQEFADIGDVERRKVFRSLSDDQYGDIMEACRAFPRIVLEKVDFRVVGEESITPGALVTCTLRIRLVSLLMPLAELNKEYEEKKRLKAEGKLKDEDDDDKVDSLELEGEGDGVTMRRKADSDKLKLVHAPRFPNAKRPFWWVFIGNVMNNRVINASKVTDLAEKKTIRIQFQAPQQQGVFPFSVFIKSDTWIGADMRLDIQMKVEEPKPGTQADEEDDISEPEEDSIAGQMAMLRGQRPAGGGHGHGHSHGHDDDDDDSESDDE
ncbi:secretory subunit [Sorochytrium milnesiophthora]